MRGWREKFVGHEAAVQEIIFCSDGRGFSAGVAMAGVRLWDRETRVALMELGSKEQPVVAMALNPEGTLLLLGIQDGERAGVQVHRLGPNSGSLLRQLKPF